jgi:uncharacterized membrane protein
MSYSRRSQQLDLFRGVAAIFMVVNHAGYQLLGPAANAAGWPGFLVFLTSSAPALFFFATGVGAGMSGAPEGVGSVLRKVLLLMLADAFMNWGGGGWWGLDFFGFAAIATAVLALIRWSRRAVVVAWVLLLVVVSVRFGLAPMLRDSMATNPVFAFTTGVGYVLGFSYPLCPWLAFPLAGFLVGRSVGGAGLLREPGAALVLAVIGFAASFVLVRHGAVAFRWGSVSLAYFLFAVGIVAFGWVCAAGVAARPPRAVDVMKLRGAASLLVVPLHFAALALLARTLPPPWPEGPWLAAAVLMCGVVLVASRGIVAGVGARLSAPSLGSDALVILLATAAALGARLWAPSLLRLEIACAAEVAVGLLLARHGRRSVAAPSENGSISIANSV